MSNKLVRRKEANAMLTAKQKKILFWSSLSILIIAFVIVWINVFLKSGAFNKQMNEMVLGKDYYIEDVVITNKRVEDSSSDNTISHNYFFYYHDGNVNDYSKRMQVPESVYSEYDIGDSITSYTTNHEVYSYYKYGILPKAEYTSNEVMKSVGVLLGVGILALIFVGFFDRKIN